MNENLNSLWTSLSNNFDIGSFEEFSMKMQTPEERKRFYDTMSAQNVDLGDYDQYEGRLKKVPSQVGATVEGQGMASVSEVTSSGSQEDDTWIERTVGKNIVTDYFGDLWRAGEQGMAQGATVDEAFDVYKKGKNISDEELRRYIEVSDALDKTGASDEMREYEEIKNEAGGGVWGFMKGTVMTRGQWIPQVIVSSAAGMARTFFDSEEAAGITAATAGTGAVLGGKAAAVAGSIGGPIGTAIGGFVGAGTGAIGGAVAGLTGSMETALTLTELLKEELGDKEFNKKNIRAILEDEEVFEDIKDRALARGLTVGAVEGITVGLSRGVGAKLLSKGAGKGKIARQVTGIEMGGGMVGEAGGQVAAGQEFDIAEVLMEGVAEAKGVVNVADMLAKKTYKINGEERTKKEVLDKINNTKPESLAKIQFEVTGDKNLDQLIKQKQADAVFETQIDERVEKGDRKKLVELEKKRAKAEVDKEKKGIFAVPGAEANLENIEGQIAEIIGRYEGADITDKTVQARKKTAQEVRSVWLKGTKAFAKVASEQLGFNPFESFKENSGFVSAMVERVMSLQEYTFDGVKVDLSTMTEAQIEAEANRIADSSNQADAVNIPTADGNQAIMINEEAAFKYGALQAGSHEVLHGVMKGALANLAIQDKKDGGNRVKNLISDFKLNVEKNLGKNVVKLIEQRLKNSYGDTINLETTDEWFTALSDIIEDEKNNITYKNNKGFFDGVKNKVASIFNKNTAYKNLSVETGEDAFNFMKEYSQNVKEGKLSERMLAFASGVEGEFTGGKRVSREGEVDEVSKFSKSKVNLDAKEFEGMDISERIDSYTRGAKTKEDLFVRDPELRTSAFDDIYTGITQGAFDRVFGEGVSTEQRDIMRTKLADRFAGLTEEGGYNPAKTPELSKWMYGGSGVAGNIFRAAQTAKAKLFKEGEIAKKTTSIDTEEAKQVADTPTETTTPVKKGVKLRKLKDFNIELEDGLVDAEIIAQVEDLIEKNPDNLQEELDNLINNELRKLLDNTIGKIEKKEGKVSASPDYQKFISNEYNEIVQSLGIKTIRSAYKNWFEKKKVGTEKKKGISKTTGKVTNFVVGIYENTTNKPKYIKYFTEGSYTGLRERRNALIKRIARRKAENAVDNYIQANSTNIDAIMESKLRQLSTATDNIANEQKSFDAVKFSKSLKEEYNAIADVVKKKGKIWVGYTNPHTGLPQTFVDKGRIWEQAFANYFMKMKIKGLKVLSEVATEIGAMADFVFEYNGITENHELKAAITAFMGSVSMSNFGFKNGKIKLATDVHNDLLKEVDMAEFKKGYKKRIDFVNKGIEKLNKKRPKDKQYPLLDYDVTSGKPQYIPYELYMDSDFGNKVFYQLKSDEKVIQTHYGGKDVHSMSFVGTKNGNMSVRLSEKSMLNLPMLNADTLINFTFRNSGSKMVNGEKMIALNLGIQFKISKLKNDPSTTPDISNIEDFKKSLGIQFSKSISKTKTLNNAVNFSRSANNPTKGITILDFDDTLATSKSLVKYTTPEGDTGTLNAEQFASTYQDLQDKGYTFDFTEFNKVVKGKIAPLFQKALKLQEKFGPENMFVLTARNPEAQKAIFDFLKANGLNIPIKNITGLGDSTSEAKALWIADKVGEGFNDFYFADDALQNVQAVKNMLDQFDVKSKVQQAKVKFSKSMNTEFNNILEDLTDIESKKRFSAIKARKRGAEKGKFRFFIPPSHEDFVGLLYNFLGEGRKGDAHRNFFEDALIRPLNRAYRELNTARQSIANDYKALNKRFENVRDKLAEKTPDGDFTYQDAIRVYLWDKHNYKIPGLSPTDQAKLVELVNSDPELQAYAGTLNVISKQEAYVNPTENWEVGDIRTDLDDATGRVGRAQFFTEFNENVDIIFSEENLNKIEAAYGTDVRSAIEDSLYRTKTGRNRPSGQNAQVNRWMNYLNGSVASTMFVNVRSAVLQQMSIVNFINFADNNVFAVAKAFANLPQYFDDWAYIFNSDFMKQRRGGIKTDVNGAELAASLKGAKNTPRALLGKLLQLGFLPTQIGDNVAIATGGAPFYRNRINTYLKQGLSQKEAETKAWIDFQKIAEETQQSARPDMVSQQQASPLGKVILAFQNVTSQFNRIGKKAFLDIKNRRITPGNTTQLQSDVSNVSRIAYYFAVQNIVFYSLQTALFAMMFDDDADEEKLLKKKERVISGTIDSVLRGAGVMGSVVATLKNMAIKFAEQRKKGYNADESAVVLEMLNVSPPLGIKARKLVNAEKTLNYNKKVIDEMETLDIDNPVWSAVTNVIEATTNAPLNRMYNKTINMRNALDNQYTAFQRAMFSIGFTTWSLDLGDTQKMKDIKEKTKDNKKKKSSKKRKPLSRGRR